MHDSTDTPPSASQTDRAGVGAVQPSGEGVASHFQTNAAAGLRPPPGAPTIGIPAWRFPVGRAYRLSASVDLPSAYCDAIVAAGGMPFLLTPYFPARRGDSSSSDPGLDPGLDPDGPPPNWLDDLVARLDGVVLAGGPDVQPALYGQPAHESVYLTSDVQDGFEAELYRSARRLGVPILAICRGLQLVNVVHGGTLEQHLGDRTGLLAHGVPEGGGAARTQPILDAHSEVALAMGTTHPSGNCHHHQAVDVVGDGLEVVGRTSDGIVEALAPLGGGDLLAVQWHPEETALDDPSQLGLFRWLVERSSRVAARRASTGDR